MSTSRLRRSCRLRSAMPAVRLPRRRRNRLAAPLTVVESRPLPAPPPRRRRNHLRSPSRRLLREGTGVSALMDIMAASNRFGTPQEVAARGDRATSGAAGNCTGKSFTNQAGYGASLGRVGHAESRSSRATSADTAYHLAYAVPFLGAPAQQVATDLQRGDPAAAVGHAAAMVVPFAAGPARGSLAWEHSRGAAGISRAKFKGHGRQHKAQLLPDVAQGNAKVRSRSWRALSAYPCRGEAWRRNSHGGSGCQADRARDQTRRRSRTRLSR